ncbi:MAG: hypothetical protein MHM6MM_002646 [Cercozoa sp. M6MM]
MDDFRALWKEIGTTPVGFLKGELSKTSTLCTRLLPQLSARLSFWRSSSNRCLPKRFLRTLKDPADTTCAVKQETYAALQKLLIVVIDRLLTDATSLLDQLHVYTMLESLTARVLRIPRLHVRIITKGTVCKRTPFTVEHCERLVQILRALDVSQLCDDADVWVAESRHLRLLVAQLRAGVTDTATLQKSLRLEPLKRTYRLLSPMTSCHWYASVMRELKHNKIVLNQRRVQHAMVEAQLEELHTLSLQSLAHYKWQFNIYLHDKAACETTYREYARMLLEECNLCTAFRRHLDLCTQAELDERDRLYEAVVSPHVSRLVNRHSGAVYRQLLREIADYSLRRTHAVMSIQGSTTGRLGLYNLQVSENTFVETVNKLLCALPLAPSLRDWESVRRMLQELRRERSPALSQTVGRHVDTVSVLSMAALDVLRHHRRFWLLRQGRSPNGHPADRHCHSCWLRESGSLRKMRFHVHAHTEIRIARRLAAEMRPPFAVVKLTSYRRWTTFTESLVDASVMPTSVYNNDHLYFKSLLIALSRSRQYTACRQAVARGCSPGHVYLVRYTCEEAALDSLRGTAVLCVIARDGQEWTAQQLFERQIDGVASEIAQWMTSPASPLYAANVDVVGELLEWLLSVDFGGLITLALHFLATQNKSDTMWRPYHDVTELTGISAMLRRALLRHLQ